jgi:hypothetical protein
LQCGRGQAHGSNNVRHHFSDPAQISCKALVRGSARPKAFQDQLTLEGPALRRHLQDDREPRPTKVKLTLVGMSSARPRGSSLAYAPLPPGSEICKCIMKYFDPEQV